jgi:hypothetical protein
MSVEIEVGLENAARVKNLLAEELPLEEPPKGLKNPKLRRGLIAGGLVLAVIVAGLFFYYHNRESTDDAQVDGHITPVSSKIYGRVAEVLVTDNQQVKAGSGNGRTGASRSGRGIGRGGHSANTRKRGQRNV